MLLTMERTSIAFTAKAPSRSFWVFDLPKTVTSSSITESFIWPFRRFVPCALDVASTNRQSDSHSSLFMNVLLKWFRYTLFPGLSLPSNDMAGFLALPEKSAFPIVQWLMGLSIMGMTVAGTAQDSHLIPFYALMKIKTSPSRMQRYQFFAYHPKND